MNSRIVVPALFLSIALAPAIAQTESAQDEPKAAREISPDLKAYNEANRIAEPQKKIDALEKWKTDFPASPMLQSADRAILTTLVQKFPGEKDRIHKVADAMYRAAPEKNRGAVATQVADQLLGI